MALPDYNYNDDSYNYNDEHTIDINYERVYRCVEKLQKALLVAKCNGVRMRQGDNIKINLLYEDSDSIFQEIFGDNNLELYFSREGYQAEVDSPKETIKTLLVRGRGVMSITCQDSFSPGKKRAFNAVSELVNDGLVRIKEVKSAKSDSLMFARLSREMSKSSVTLVDLILQERRESN